jgi:hypothetical protein
MAEGDIFVETFPPMATFSRRCDVISAEIGDEISEKRQRDEPIFNFSNEETGESRQRTKCSTRGNVATRQMTSRDRFGEGKEKGKGG